MIFEKAMGRIRKYFYLPFLALAGVFLLFVTNVQAQEELGVPESGVQVSPFRFDWDMQSGDERIGTINLKNFSDEKKYEVEINVEDFYVSDDSSSAEFFVPDEKHPLYAYDVINWVEFPDGKNVKLEPDEGKNITFKVKVPENTPTGGYYGAIFFSSKVQEISSEEGESEVINTTIAINQRVGALLVMAVKGSEPIRREGKLESFFANQKVFLQSPAGFTVDVRNSGNLHYKANGKIDIYKFGRKLTSLDLPPRMLYPERLRSYDLQWNFSAWSYGYYKAKLFIASEDGDISMEGETVFWVIPWKTTASIIILLIIIWLIFRIFTSKFEIKLKDNRKMTISEEELKKSELEPENVEEISPNSETDDEEREEDGKF